MDIFTSFSPIYVSLSLSPSSGLISGADTYLSVSPCPKKQKKKKKSQKMNSCMQILQSSHVLQKIVYVTTSNLDTP